MNPITQLPEDSGVYCRMNELFLFEKQILMKEEIGIYLSHIFYEMSALSPHDFRTYEQMRVLAAERFNIHVMQSHLPSQQLEQGVDILMLLRETRHYVSNYHYNLHT
jgi:WASH complex subunit 7